MATKKCPKCGEENPAEAVMCWACYTPLAGGAAAVAGGGLVTPRGGAAAVPPAATAAAEDEKKAIDPKIFLVVGLLAVALLIGGFTSGIFTSGSSGGGDSGIALTVEQEPGGRPQPPPSINATTTTTTNNFPSSVSATSGGGTTGGLPPVAAPYKMMVPPDPRYANGTAAILSTTPTLTPAQAKNLAVLAKQQLAPGGKWTEMQILVFNNEGLARTFQKYQQSRNTSRLTANDFATLASRGVWSGVPAYYQSQGKSETVVNPSASPNNWWNGRGR